MSSSGFLVRDNNLFLERAVQEQYERQDIDGVYDYDTECVPNLEEILNEIRQSTYRVKAYMNIITEGGKEPGFYTLTAMGSGLLLENNRILTAAHVVSETLDRITEENSGEVITLYSVRYALYDGKKEYGLIPVWTDDVWTQNEDFALLRFANEPEKQLHCFRYEIGNSDKLRNGSVTFTFSAVNYPDIKQGNIINNERGCEWGCKTNENYFFEDTRVIPGDSGGPVIAFLDGKPQLVGITCYYRQYENLENIIVMGGGILKINLALQEAGQFFRDENIPAISNP